MNNTQIIEVIRFAMDLIEDAAKEAGPLGAPSGVVFAAMQQQGMTLNVYIDILIAMENAGKIRLEHDCILAVAA